MSMSDFAALAQAVAAFLTFGAAAVAVWATLAAPERAARIAEDLRVQNEQAENIRQEKYAIFHTMMNWRGSNLSSPESVNAINLIPVIFSNNSNVKDAYSAFVKAGTNPHVGYNLGDAYIELIVQIVIDLGLSKNITKDEINYGYFPTPTVHTV